MLIVMISTQTWHANRDDIFSQSNMETKKHAQDDQLETYVTIPSAKDYIPLVENINRFGIVATYYWSVSSEYFRIIEF